MLEKLKEYYEKIYRLEYIIRYSNVPRVHDESVAAHSFFVAAIVMQLYDVYQFNLGIALQIAVSHDIPEYGTNDISHEIKQQFPDIKRILKEAEDILLKEMPASIRTGMIRYRSGSVEALVVHAADAIQCNQYASHEISLGNLGYMVEVEEKSAIRAKKILAQLEAYKRE